MNKIAYSFIIMLLLSCNSNSGLSPKQSAMQIDYLQEITDLEIDNASFLLVPPNVCHTCVDKIYDILINNNCNPINIVIIGGIEVDSLQVVSKIPDVSVFLDREEFYFNKKYVTIAKNNIVYLTIFDNAVYSFLEISTTNIDKSLKHIITDSCN